MAQQPQVTGDHDIIISWAQNLEGADKSRSSKIKVVTAEQLSIVWGSDNRYWQKVTDTEPGSHISATAYELKDVCWLQIDGKYSAGELDEGVKYGVYFIVNLKNNVRMNGEVTLKLTRPDGRLLRNNYYSSYRRFSIAPLVKKVDLEKNYPRNEWVGLKVGEFTPNRYTKDKTFKFSINGGDGTTWKTGLIIIGAAIVPLTA